MADRKLPSASAEDRVSGKLALRHKKTTGLSSYVQEHTTSEKMLFGIIMAPITKKRRPKSARAPKELIEALRGAEESFLDKMQRPAEVGDRLFFWSYCHSDAEFKNEMIKIMLHAKIPQHLIYIYDKTGFMVNEHGYKRMPRKERKEIRDAGLEYDALEEEQLEDLYKLADYEDFGSPEDDPLVHALYILGNFIERNVNAEQQRIGNQKFICAYLLVRAFRIIRAIFRSQRYTTSEESLVLVRSLYEIYCKLNYACHSERNARYLIDSDFGLVAGEYEIQQENGKLRRHVLVHKKSRKTIPRTRSFYEYISQSPFPEDIELFNVLYEYLSSFVHSGSRHILRAWVDQRTGFSLTNANDENFKVFVLMLTCFISSMIMQTQLRMQNISHVSRWDISLFCHVTREMMTEVGTPDGSEISELLPKIKARAAVLPKRKTSPSH
jgi:uncharacterized protein DUF5677